MQPRLPRAIQHPLQLRAEVAAQRRVRFLINIRKAMGDGRPNGLFHNLPRLLRQQMARLHVHHQDRIFLMVCRAICRVRRNNRRDSSCCKLRAGIQSTCEVVR